MHTQRKKAYQQVALRDNSQCQVCGQQANDIHHIVFRSHGGADIPENLICLCRHHHDQAHKDERKWREYLINLNGKHYGTLLMSQLKRSK